MNLYKMLDKLCKQPIQVAKNTHMEVFVMGGERRYCISGIKYDRGKPVGFDAVLIGCETCKNKIEFPPAHPCDMCTALDVEEQDGEYSMWEKKIK